MGLFLSRKNTGRGKGKGQASGRGGKSSGRGGAGQQSGPRWPPQHTLAALKGLGAAVLIAGLGVGWVYARAALTRYVSERHAHTVSPADVQLADPPAWLSEGTRQRLKQRIAAPLGDDPLNRRRLEQAAHALLADPVIRDGQVRRLDGGRVRVVNADYRQPVAIIEARDGYHLVGPGGTRLSLNPYYRHQVKPLGLPLILQVNSAPPRAPGEKWQGEAVEAALSVIRLLRDKPYFDQIRAVDASRRDARGRLRLMLHTGEGRIGWGFPPGKERAIEPDATEKLQRLRRLARRHHGSINAGGRRVNIYGPAIQFPQAAVENARARSPR